MPRKGKATQASRLIRVNHFPVELIYGAWPDDSGPIKVRQGDRCRSSEQQDRGIEA